jgi:protein-L-isoaspartate(D-aspartate) O-methyltransferase
MVDSLRTGGSATDRAVLDVMARVPREAFVPRFWSLPPGSTTGRPDDVQEFIVGEDEASAETALELVYDTDHALGIRRDARPLGLTAGAGVTSTASAPRIVASMLELAQLAAGMRVLEIGTGSGYNTALLQELVGPRGRVTSVDIDRTLVDDARRRLDATGYPDVSVVAADGYFGAAERAPFDRVVATVGCVDVAPAWLGQLAPGGFCVVPLQHGGWHPLTRAEPNGDGARLTVVGPAGFVAIQGQQAGCRPWPHAGRLGPEPEVEWSPLPDELAAGLFPAAGDEGGDRAAWAGPPWAGPAWARAAWARAAWARPSWGRVADLAYLVALEDRRAAFGASLSDGTSSASLDPDHRRVGHVGAHGRDLHNRLLEIMERWAALGYPGMGDYLSTLSPLGAWAPAGSGPQASWAIDRFDYRQSVALSR